MLRDAIWPKRNVPHSLPWLRVALADGLRVAHAGIVQNVNGGAAAAVAQLMEYRTRNAKVVSAVPTAGSCFSSTFISCLF